LLEVRWRAAASGAGVPQQCIGALSEAQQHIRGSSSPTPAPSHADTNLNVRSLITSQHGRAYFRSLARALRPLLQVKAAHPEDDFRLPSAALSPILHSGIMSPSRDSFASPPPEATAKELVQRLEDLDDVFKNLTFDSPVFPRTSAAFSELDLDADGFDDDSDIDSLNGDDTTAMIKSPRVGTIQLISLVDDLVSNLDRLAPRALAQKLERLASGLNALNFLPAAAVEVASMEVALYRKQSLLATPAGRADLVNALDNLSTALEACGRAEEAVALTAEMVQHLRNLREQRPLPMQASFGLALNKFTRRLAALGKYTDALITSEEFVELCEKLAAQDGRRYRADLGTAYFNKAACLQLLGRNDAALGMCKEALSIRQSVCQQPAVLHQHVRALAESHLQLSEFLAQDGNLSEALQAAHDAVAAFHASPAQDRDASDTLAAALSVQAIRLRENHQALDALAVTRKAVSIYRILCTHGSEVYAGAFARSLCRLGQDELIAQPPPRPSASAPTPMEHPALLAYAEAISCLRPLYAEMPIEFGSDFAKALLAYSTCLGAAGRVHDSTTAVRESLGVLRRISDHLSACEDDYVKGLIRLCASLTREGTAAEGLAVSTELVELQRRRAAIQPEMY